MPCRSGSMGVAATYAKDAIGWDHPSGHSTVYVGGMDAARARFRRRVPYEARLGRSAVVAADLADLHGSTSGVVELPHRLFWQLDRHVDVDTEAARLRPDPEPLARGGSA